MPHQRGDHPLAYGGGGPGHGPGHGIIRDGRESTPHPMHPADFQNRRVGLRMVHHPSPGGQGGMHPRHLHPAMYGGPHPHSPSWYGSMAASPPHRVPGSTMSVASACSTGEHESLIEEQHQPVAKKEDVQDKERAEETRDKASIIEEALKRHMDDDYSIGTNEADAASALLFATSAMRRAASCKVSVTGSKTDGREAEEEEAVEETKKEQNDDSNLHHQENREYDEEEKKEETLESSVPLKKRRKLLDFLRKKPVTTAAADKPPLHVSPLPSPQVGTRGESSEDTLASTSPQRTTGSSSTCLAHSYDMKEAQCLHEGEKISNAAEISPPPLQVVIEHFPTVLHNVLTNSEFAGNVIQWLPNGNAWKILRWDALRRKVLPKYFSQLHDEDGKVASSIDAFLWHLSGWGFVEVHSGPDVGAYTNEFFRKDSPQLCRKMHFEPKQGDLESPTVSKTTASITDIADKLHEASQHHSILQVPSLTSRTGSDAEGTAKEGVKNLKWREEQRANGGIMHSPAISYPSMRGRPMRHPETPIFVNYRVGDLAYSDGWQYFSESPVAMRHMGSTISEYEHRLLQQQRFEFGMPTRKPMALHSPPRVQSGRGALRLATASKAGLAGKIERPMRRSSFPVSNRGKGGRGSPAAARIPSVDDAARHPGVTAKAQPDAQSNKEGDTDRLQKLSEEVAQRVAIAISKRTKRKLPLAGGASQEPASQEKTEDVKGNEDEGDEVEEDDEATVTTVGV